MTLVETPANRTFAVATIEHLADSASGYISAARAPRTVERYQSDWRLFTRWCNEHGLEALPAEPQTVAMYLADLAGVRAIATMQVRLTSISQIHQLGGFESPTRSAVVRETWHGIRRTFGTASEGKAPTRTADVRAMVDTLGDDLLGVRNRALLLIGFAGAMRRSEIVALDVEDLVDVDDGLVVNIRRSKTDQEGQGARIGLPYGSDPSTCPVRAWRAWVDAAAVTEGPAFRSFDHRHELTGRRLTAQQVTRLVKRCAGRLGLDPARYGAHSLRAGLITSAAEAGTSERDIMRHSRHKSITVMRRYVRDVGLFDANAAAAVGL